MGPMESDWPVKRAVCAYHGSLVARTLKDALALHTLLQASIHEQAPCGLLCPLPK